MPRLLSVDADLTIDIGDQQVCVRGNGSRIVLEVPSIRLAFRMLRELGNLKAARSRLANSSRTMAAIGMTLTVRTPALKLLTMGSGGNSALLRLFGVR